jgi:hypothetical protein
VTFESGSRKDIMTLHEKTDNEETHHSFRESSFTKSKSVASVNILIRVDIRQKRDATMYSLIRRSIEIKDNKRIPMVQCFNGRRMKSTAILNYTDRDRERGDFFTRSRVTNEWQ